MELSRTLDGAFVGTSGREQQGGLLASHAIVERWVGSVNSSMQKGPKAVESLTGGCFRCPLEPQMKAEVVVSAVSIAYSTRDQDGGGRNPCKVEFG